MDHSFSGSQRYTQRRSQLNGGKGGRIWMNKESNLLSSISRRKNISTYDVSSSSADDKSHKLNDVSSSSADDDDPPILSFQAIAALKEFLAKQNPSVIVPDVKAEGDLKVALVSENWRLSQFWYDLEMAKALADKVVTLCEGFDSRVTFIDCPTPCTYLKKINPSVSVQLLEYDKYFEQYGSDYTFMTTINQRRREDVKEDQRDKLIYGYDIYIYI
ncbi:Protein-lysine N-methyltransferase [Quillaja saponaria]|uniref:Protein-lysine N-methyltransferase n=1 Tax=Quillaja saponaria TaxID=32244 RepID=A0AAD7PCA7_QUISA|nr:Protein-lysine N-methyltransferase [Quillaja saponaria]